MTSKLDSASDDAARAGVKQAEKELDQLDAAYAEMAADAALTAGSMAPPPFGTVADVVSIGKSLWTGDWGRALLDVVGLLPLPGDAIKGAGKGAKIANKMTEVRLPLLQRGDDEDVAHFAFARDSLLLEPWLEVNLIADGHSSPHVWSVWSVGRAEESYLIYSSRE